MAPIKFEEQIKNKLEKRSLSPSQEGWAKLSERLDAEETSSKFPWYWWVSIAAGLVIMLALTVQHFNAEDGQKTMPRIVEEKPTEIKVEEKQPILMEANENQFATDNTSEAENKFKSVKEPSQIKKYKSVTNNKQKAKIQLAHKSQKEETLKEDVNTIDIDKINTTALTNAINEFKTENSTVSDRVIDSLLKVASKELLRDKLQSQTTKTVDANALLESVEDEMGQSFRSKVFDALKGSYETVKTAVAERNN